MEECQKTQVAANELLKNLKHTLIKSIEQLISIEFQSDCSLCKCLKELVQMAETLTAA